MRYIMVIPLKYKRINKTKTNLEVVLTNKPLVISA